MKLLPLSKRRSLKPPLNNMQAVILAAGKGTRLKPITETLPKPLVEICEKPLLKWIFEALPEEIDEYIVIVGYLSEQITERFGNTWNGKPIRYIVQDPLTGTGGGVHLAKEFLKGRFLVVNGDDLYEKKDLEALMKNELALLTYKSDKPVPAAALTNIEGNFIGLLEDNSEETGRRRVCGAYVLDERFFDYPLVEIWVAKYREWGLPQTLVEMAGDHKIKLVEASFWQPVGTHEELETAQERCSEQ